MRLFKIGKHSAKNYNSWMNYIYKTIKNMDNINFMKMFLHMGALTNRNEKEELEFQERIVFSTPGIIKPENWDKLEFTEKKKRMSNLLKQM